MLIMHWLSRFARAPTFLTSRILARNYYDPTAGRHEPYHPLPGRFPKWQEAGEAMEAIESGCKIFIHGGAATPTLLVDSLCDYVLAKNVKDVSLYHIHTEGSGRFTAPEMAGHLRSNSLFTGANCRRGVAEGIADYTPIFLSEIPSLFRKGYIKLDVVLISVTTPDSHGFCSLGPSVDCVRAALQNANYIIGQVNPHMPRTRGDASIHVSHLDSLVHGPAPMPQLKIRPSGEQELKIGKLIAGNLVKDNATLQMGIGSIPDAVLAQLFGHKQLGVHTEMFSDGVVDLVHAGCITNAHKKLRPGKIVSSFVIGTEKVFKFLDDNPFVDMCDIAWVNNTSTIQQNPRVTAINSCIEVDITGQVVSDSIGTKIYSGFGGQIDFIRGAAQSLDGEGVPIIALASVTNKGQSKIVPTLKPGAGVVTTRAHVHYIVTEHGIAFLFGKNLRQRAHALINVADPEHRESLEKAAFERLKCMPSPD